MSHSSHGRTSDLYSSTFRHWSDQQDGPQAVDATSSCTPDTSFSSFKNFMDTQRSDANSDGLQQTSEPYDNLKRMTAPSPSSRVNPQDANRTGDRDQVWSNGERAGARGSGQGEQYDGVKTHKRPGPRVPVMMDEDGEEEIRSGLVVELLPASEVSGGANTTPLDSSAQSATAKPPGGLKYRVMSGRINFQPVIHGGSTAVDSSSASEASLQLPGSSENSVSVTGKRKEKKKLGDKLKSLFKGSSKSSKSNKDENFFGLPTLPADRVAQLGIASSSVSGVGSPESVGVSAPSSVLGSPQRTPGLKITPSQSPPVGVGLAHPISISHGTSPDRSTVSGHIGVGRVSPATQVATSNTGTTAYAQGNNAARLQGHTGSSMESSSTRPGPPAAAGPPDIYGQPGQGLLPSTLFVGGGSSPALQPRPAVVVQQTGGSVYGPFVPGPPSGDSISIAGRISGPGFAGSTGGSLVGSGAVASVSGHHAGPYGRVHNSGYLPPNQVMGPSHMPGQTSAIAGQPTRPAASPFGFTNVTTNSAAMSGSQISVPPRPAPPNASAGPAAASVGQPTGSVMPAAPPYGSVRPAQIPVSQPAVVPAGRVGGPFHAQRPGFAATHPSTMPGAQLLAPRPSLTHSGSTDTLTTKWSDSTEAAGQSPQSRLPGGHPFISVPSDPLSPTGRAGPLSPTQYHGPLSPTNEAPRASKTTLGPYQTLQPGTPHQSNASASGLHTPIPLKPSSAPDSHLSQTQKSQMPGPGQPMPAAQPAPASHSPRPSQPSIVVGPADNGPLRSRPLTGDGMTPSTAYASPRAMPAPVSPARSPHRNHVHQQEDVDLISNRSGGRPAPSPRRPHAPPFDPMSTEQSDVSLASTSFSPRLSPRMMAGAAQQTRPGNDQSKAHTLLSSGNTDPHLSPALLSNSSGYSEGSYTRVLLESPSGRQPNGTGGKIAGALGAAGAGPVTNDGMPRQHGLDHGRGAHGMGTTGLGRVSGFEVNGEIIADAAGSATMRHVEPRGERGRAARLWNAVQGAHNDSHVERAAVSAFLDHVASTLSPPGVQPVVEGLQQLYRDLDTLMLNMANFRRLFQRMLLVLAILCEVLVGKPMPRTQWLKIMAVLQDTREAMSAYMGQASQGRWLAVLHHGHFQQDLLAGWWSSLSAAGTALFKELPATFHARRDWETMLPKPGRFKDDCTEIKNAMSSLGGWENILTENVVTTTPLVSMLNQRKRYRMLDIPQMQQAMWVMAAEREHGPHRIISHPALRLFWHRCLSSRRAVPWSEFWEEFPQQLRDIGVDGMEWEGVGQLMESEVNRQRFEIHITPGSSDYITPIDLEHAFPKDTDLLQTCLSICGIVQAHHLPPGFSHSAILSGILHIIQTSGTAGSLQTLLGGPGCGKSFVIQHVRQKLDAHAVMLASAEDATPARVPSFCASFLDAGTEQEMRGRVASAVGCIVEGENTISLQVRLQRLSSVGPFVLCLEDVSEAVKSEAGCRALASVVKQFRTRAPNVHILITSSVEFQLPEGLTTETWHLEPCSVVAAFDLYRHYNLVMHEAAAQQLTEACQYHPLTLAVAVAAIAHGHCTPEDILLARSDGPSDAVTMHGANYDFRVIRMVLSRLPQVLQNALVHLAILPQSFSATTAAQMLHNVDGASPNVDRDEFYARGILAALCSRGLLVYQPSTATYSMPHSLQACVTKTLCASMNFPDTVISSFHKSCCDLLQAAGSLYKEANCALALKWANHRRMDLFKFLHMLEIGVLSMTLFWNVSSLALAMPVVMSLGVASEASILSIWDTIQPNFARKLSPQHPSFVSILLAHGEQCAVAGNMAKAINLYRCAVQVMSIGNREPKQDVDPVLFADALEKLGMALAEEQLGAEAVSLLRQALQIKLRLKDAMSIEVAETRIKLGAVLDVNGNNPKDAELVLTEGYNALVKAVPKGHHHLRFVDMFLKLAASYMSESHFSAAELVYNLVLEIQQQFYEPTDPRLVRTLCKLAHAIRQQDRADEAIQLYRQALQLQDSFYGPGSQETVQTRLKLANRMRESGHVDQAEELYSEALQLQEHHLGESHPETVTTLCELGDISFSQKMRSAAERYYWKAAQVMDTASIPPQTAVRILKRLVAVVDAAAKPEVSEELHRRLLNMLCQAYGERSKAVAEAQLKLGKLLHRQGKTNEALDFTHHGIDTLTELEGDTWRVAAARKDFASQLCAVQHYHDAEEELCKAVNIEYQLSDMSGEDKVCLTEGLLKLAEVLKLQGKMSQAEEALEWLVEIHKQGPAATSTGSSIGLARLLMNLTAVREQQDKLELAYDSFHEALQIFEALRRAPDGWRREDLLVRVADLAHKIQRFQQAELYYRSALKLMQASGGQSSSAIPEVLSKCAASLSGQQRFEEAERFCSQALQQQHELLGENHPDVVPTLLVYGDAILSQGREREAEELYWQAIQILEFLSSNAHVGLLRRAVAAITPLLESHNQQQRLTHVKQLMQQLDP